MGTVVRLQNDADQESTKSGSNKKVRTKQSFTKVLVSRLPRYLIYLTICYIAIAFGDQLLKINEMDREMDKVNQQMALLHDRNEQLRQEINNLQSKTYVERIAREKLGLVKPGEVVILQAEDNRQIEEIESRGAGDIH